MKRSNFKKYARKPDPARKWAIILGSIIALVLIVLTVWYLRAIWF